MRRIAFMAAVSALAVACALLSATCLPAEHIGLPHTWVG
jgi:hypothetical protein